IILVVYEFGMALLLFKVNVLSHRLFMAIVYAMVVSVIYIWIQL
ncbi:MAG: ABC transporter permease, partial [Staphylococcus warneri]|nr:ABC transporter permease [Staphylococcus warneri]